MRWNIFSRKRRATTSSVTAQPGHYEQNNDFGTSLHAGSMGESSRVQSGAYWHHPTFQTSLRAKPRDETLCGTCEQLDFKSLFHGQRIEGPRDFNYENLRVYVKPIGSILKTQWCAFCKLLKFAIFESNPNLPKENGYLICASSECDPFYVDWDEVSCYLVPMAAAYVDGCSYSDRTTQQKVGTALWVNLVHPSKDALFGSCVQPINLLKSPCLWNHTGFLKLHFDETNLDVIRERPLLNGIKALEKEPDYRLFAKWINYCQKHHLERCVRSKITFAQDAFEAFRVIDVKNRMIVRANPEKDDYAALSYVWGASYKKYENFVSDLEAINSSSSIRMNLDTWSKRRTLPPQLPLTFADALFVCEKIDMPYLWIDLFCIQQDDEDDKRIQMRSMGAVYSNASVVILAACGQSCNSGLSGIGGYDGYSGLDGSNVRLSKRQMIQKIQGRNMITALNSSLTGLLSGNGSWSRRGWTFQEGYLATRCLGFGANDVAFVCRTGSCRDSWNNSTEATYNIAFPQDQSMESLALTLCGSSHEKKWHDIIDYAATVREISTRCFTRDDDVLNALSGYFQIIERVSSFHFIQGLPKEHILDALCWLQSAASDMSVVPEFPSWSWAGWRILPDNDRIVKRIQTSGTNMIIYPFVTGLLESFKPDDYQSIVPKLRYLECQFVIVLPAQVGASEVQSPENIVKQYVPRISLLTDKAIRLETEIAAFRFGILPGNSKTKYSRICIITRNGHRITPWCSERWAGTVFSETGDEQYLSWNWAFRSPVQCLMLKRWEEIYHGPNDILNYVVAVPLDPRWDRTAFRRTCALFLIPNNIWDEASPTRKTVTLV